MAKRIITAVLLAMVAGLLSAQETIMFQDESFILDSAFTQKKNYKFIASDSIVLDTNFCRISHSSFPSCDYYTEFVIDENGVYPPSAGLQGGPNETDNGYVGTLGGTIDVGMMGEANYFIPIDLPVGINGMTPELSIVYNSQNGNGLLGWRWELSGLSSITRTGKTRYHDGVTGGVTLSDNNDRFLLDGQRLIAVQRYADSVEFKTELDGMSRIVAYLSRYNNGTKVICNFKVWKADGRIIEYGATNDSRIETQDNRPNALCWLINQIHDRNGNAITFHYDVSNETGEFYVSQIRYTENEDLKIAPEFIINFVYRKNEKIDYDFKYIAGNIIQKKKLLKRMEILRTADEELISKYSFQYDEIDLYDTYDSVHMYNRLRVINYEKGNMALNPTRIEWTSYGDANVVCKSNIYNQAIYDNFPFVGDFNGDGYSDLAVVPFKNDSIYYSAPVDVQFFMNNQNNGFSLVNVGMDTQPTKLDWIYVLDIDDDGYDDLVTFYYDSLPERSEIMVYRNTRIRDSICFIPVWEDPLWFNNKARVVIGDFEGEGKQSILAYAITTSDQTIANITYVTYTNGWCYTHHVNYEGDGIMKVHQTEPGDYDGDGKTELFLISQNESHVLCLVNKEQYRLVEKFEVSEVSAAGGTGKNQVFSGDFNGDGLSDLLFYGHINQRNHRTNDEGYYFMFSKATSFDQSIRIIENIQYDALPIYSLYINSIWKIVRNTANQRWNSVCISDFDGDGISDVAVIRVAGPSSNIDIYFKFKRDNGRFLTKFYSSSYNGSHTGAYINCRTQYMHVGTFINKENCSFLGLQKVVTKDDEAQRIPGIFALKSVGELNNVKDITDGLDNKTTFNYGMIMEPYQYYGYNVRRLPVPIRVLDSVSSSNVADKPVSTVYEFVSPCFHRDGHGFIGFRQTGVITKRNGRNHRKAITEYTLEMMNGHAMLLPKQQTDSVYPLGNSTATLLSKTVLSFQKVVNSQDTLVACPAVTKKEVWNYNVDSNNGNVLSKEVVEYDYNYTIDNLGDKGLYTHSYDCTESRTGIHNTNVSAVSNCDFKTIVTNVYDNVYPNVWILERKSKQITTQSAIGKEDIVNTRLFDYVSNNSYQLSRLTDIPDAELSSDPLTLLTEYDYTATGNLRSETVSVPFENYQEQPRRKQYEYGPYDNGRLMTSETIDTSPVIFKNTYSYDNYDNLDTLVGYNGLAVCHDTDPLGITSLANNPDGTVAARALRWAPGMRFAPKNASYYRWSRTSGRAKQMVFYHKTGVELRTVSFGPQNEPIFIDKKYNDKGLLDSVSNPYFMGDTIVHWTHYEYDYLDRLVSITTPDSVRTETIYQGLMTETHVIAPNMEQRQSQMVTNVKGWTVSNCDPNNVTINYDYYSDGKLASVQTDNNTNTNMSFQYDHRRNRIRVMDPDYGKTLFVYNAYGELVNHITPKSDVFTYFYDNLGRLVEKRDSGENITTSYYYNNHGRLKGTLHAITYADQTLYYEYDTLVRPVRITEKLFGKTYTTNFGYDDYSRVSRVTYPTGVEIQNGYSVFGHHLSVSESKGRLLWHADKTNAVGQLLQTTMGNDIVTNKTYDAKMHYLTGIETSKNLQSLHYDYDKFGNLAARTDLLREMTETFAYDSLDRLTHVHFGQLYGQNNYDGFGRMTSKQAIGMSNGTPTVQTVFSQPQFDAQKIHAVTQANVSLDWLECGRFLATYTSFDKIRNARGNNGEMDFWYGYDEQRIKTREHGLGQEREKIYVSGCEFMTENHPWDTTTRTFLVCPTGVFAVVEQYRNKSSLHYILKDHLGSWTVIADEDGVLEQELSYDAWGNRRDPDTWCVDATIQPLFDRGYTGHEHLPNFNLINMNGRMYDPVMSSFLSVDRYVQDPGNSQGFNRYAYCMYNPLRFTDPSGWQMIGGNKPRNPFHDDWSVSHVQPVFEPSDFRNAYHMVNQAFLGGSSMYGSPYGDYFQSGADFYKGESPSVVWFSGSLAGNYVLNPSTFNRRELVDLGVRDFTYSAWWAESGYGGYQMNLTYDFGTYSYGDDNYYYGYKGYLGAIVGGKDLSRKNYSDLGVLGEMINVGGYAGGTATLVGGAAKITGVAAGVSKAIETIGTVCSVVGGTALVINAGVNYHRYRNGDITLYSMLARDFMTLVETGIAQLPYGIGIVPSIALTAYDIGGGFEHTFYNQEWTREFFSPNYDFQQVPIYYRHGK